MIYWVELGGHRPPNVALEAVFQPELNLPAISRSCDGTESGGRHRAIGYVEVRMVDRVEEFGSELNLMAFGKAERLHHCQVPVVNSRSL